MTESTPQQEPGTQAGASSSAIEPRTVEGGQGWNWIAQAWELFKKNPGIWIVNVILLLVIWIVLGMLPVVGQIAVHVLMPVMIGGLMLGCRALDRGAAFEVAHLFEGFKVNTSQLVMIGVFYVVIGLLILGIAFLVVFLAGGGALISAAVGGNVTSILATGVFLVFLLLGLLVVLLFAIPLMMACWFAPALVVFRNLTAVDAMKLSFSACLRNIVPFLVYGLVSLIFAVLASIPAGLGWLLLAPVLIASVYTGYRDVFPET